MRIFTVVIHFLQWICLPCVYSEASEIFCVISNVAWCLINRQVSFYVLLITFNIFFYFRFITKTDQLMQSVIAYITKKSMKKAIKHSTYIDLNQLWFSISKIVYKSMALFKAWLIWNSPLSSGLGSGPFGQCLFTEGDSTPESPPWLSPSSISESELSEQ